MQGTTKQIYTSAPVVEQELLQLSVRLFKKKMSAGQEKADQAPVPSAPAEVCVSWDTPVSKEHENWPRIRLCCL